MRVELDHLFICTSPCAPEAEELVNFGLREGPSNSHPGQGTANRRFFFANAMIELLWVSDQREAQSESTRRTLLWERWSNRDRGACPFGICLRPVDLEDGGSPFPGWEYRPAYLPDPLMMHIGDAGVREPMWVYLSFMRGANRQHNFAEHPAGVRNVTAVNLTAPELLQSAASRKLVESGVLSTQIGTRFLLRIEFDGGSRNEIVDFRPRLPLVFQL